MSSITGRHFGASDVVDYAQPEGQCDFSMSCYGLCSGAHGYTVTGPDFRSVRKKRRRKSQLQRV
jgi:hypothetical protein